MISACITAIYAQSTARRRLDLMESDEESTHWRRKVGATSQSSITPGKIGVPRAVTTLTTQQKLDSTLEDCILEGMEGMRPPPPRASVGEEEDETWGPWQATKEQPPAAPMCKSRAPVPPQG
eukprot:6477782-Amphidinium_carterae.1